MNQAQFEALIREVRAINENLTRIHASVIDLATTDSGNLTGRDQSAQIKPNDPVGNLEGKNGG